MVVLTSYIRNVFETVRLFPVSIQRRRFTFLSIAGWRGSVLTLGVSSLSLAILVVVVVSLPCRSTISLFGSLFRELAVKKLVSRRLVRRLSDGTSPSSSWIWLWPAALAIVAPTSPEVSWEMCTPSSRCHAERNCNRKGKTIRKTVVVTRTSKERADRGVMW